MFEWIGIGNRLALFSCISTNAETKVPTKKYCDLTQLQSDNIIFSININKSASRQSGSFVHYLSNNRGSLRTRVNVMLSGPLKVCLRAIKGMMDMLDGTSKMLLYSFARF